MPRNHQKTVKSNDEPNYDSPQNFEVFHECSEEKQWELYRDMRELYESTVRYCEDAAARVLGWREESFGLTMDAIDQVLNHGKPRRTSEELDAFIEFTKQNP